MILTYHPAFDLNNTLFRVLLCTEKTKGQPIEIEKVRILDFYMLFPRLISTIRPVDPTYKRARDSFKTYTQYESIEDPIRTFYQMREIQHAAIDGLKARGYLVSISSHSLKRTDKVIPAEILSRIDEREKSNQVLFDFLYGYLLTIPLLGRKGLKTRTRLLPSKHDPV